MHLPLYMQSKNIVLSNRAASHDPEFRRNIKQIPIVQNTEFKIV